MDQSNKSLEQIMEDNKKLNKDVQEIHEVIKEHSQKTAPKNNVAEDKFQASLLPMDIIVPMLEPAYREGIIKYRRESWRLGFNSTTMYDALKRHLDAWFYELESFDSEAEEKHNIKKHHLGAAMFCLINLYMTEFKFPKLDDRPLKLLEEIQKEIEGTGNLTLPVLNEETQNAINGKDLL